MKEFIENNPIRAVILNTRKILSLFNNVDYDYTLMEMYPQADFKIYARVTCVYALPR
jgi:hypothetical protein